MTKHVILIGIDILTHAINVFQYDWIRYLRLVFNDAGVQIDMDEPVVLWMKQYYDELFPLLERTSNRYLRFKHFDN